MLVHGYQPAQDIHVLVNPNNTALSPRYELNDDEEINTPEWNFLQKTPAAVVVAADSLELTFLVNGRRIVLN